MLISIISTLSHRKITLIGLINKSNYNEIMVHEDRSLKVFKRH